MSALLGLLLASMWPAAMSLVSTEKTRYFDISPETLSAAIGDDVAHDTYPDRLRLAGVAIDGDLQVRYTIDPGLQGEAERLLERYNPDFGVLVALEPESGRVLAMAESTRDYWGGGNLSLRNTFPAASVSKIVTAVAALDQGIADVETVIPFNGKTTTLYKKHVFKHSNNKWTRNHTLRESFGRSNNTVFGRLGAVDLGGETLLEYFQRMGFNARFTSDFPFDNGAVELDTSDDWEVAESASGYTRRNTLSPMHAATLGATAVNGGNMVAPAIVDSVLGPHGIPLYVYDQPAVSPAMDAATADKLKKLMIQTVESGSARKPFRGFHRGDYADVVVGGKTGSLTGNDPQGRYDWFVGFAERGERRLAFAALCINKEKWYVKSGRLARELVEFHFQPPPEA